MTVYNYLKESGEYIGEELAMESPLEPGVFLIPANATKEKPTIMAGVGKALIWRDGKWKIVIDNREKEIIIFSSETEFGRLTSQTIELPENAFLFTKELETAMRDGKHFKMTDGQIIIEDKTEKEVATERIRELKRELSSNDYKIIKNAEALAAGVEYPYPAEALQAERQAMREEINKLEIQL